MWWSIPAFFGIVIVFIVIPIAIDYYKDYKYNKDNGGKDE